MNWTLLILHALYGATSHLLGMKAGEKIENAVAPYEGIIGAVAGPSVAQFVGHELKQAGPLGQAVTNVGVAVASGTPLAQEAGAIAGAAVDALNASHLSEAQKGEAAGAINLAGALLAAQGASQGTQGPTGAGE